MLIGKDKTYRTRLISGSVGLLNDEIYYYQNSGDIELLVNDKDTIVWNTSIAISLQKGVMIANQKPLYESINYVQISGTGNYIDTLVPAVDKTSVEVQFGREDGTLTSNRCYIFAQGNRGGVRYADGGMKLRGAYGQSTWSDSNTVTFDDVNILNYARGNYKLNGDTITGFTLANFFEGTYTIGNWTTSYSAIAIKIYYFKIWDADKDLVFDAIPVKRTSDNAIGLLDKVSGSFFGNEGSDPLIGG